MWMNHENLVRRIMQTNWAKDFVIDEDLLLRVMDWTEKNVLGDFLAHLIRKVDELINIDPGLSEPDLLGEATRHVVEFLGARSASVRIYDPHTEQMLSYGSYPSKELARATFIPLEGSIAGEVVKTGRPFIVPSIMKEPLYKDKEIVARRGVNSLMAIPIEIPRFFPDERSTVGVVQIYYSEDDRVFAPVETQVANLMAKRLSFVMARKKIILMRRTKEKRDAIVGHIFRALGARGGVKMRDIFNKVIPEIADIVNLQACTLFSVTDDLRTVVLEAGYPDRGGYHSIGKSFSTASEPAFELVLKTREYKGNSLYEVVTPSYVLVVDPQRSELISQNLKKFAYYHNINSILYIPLTVEGDVTHFMAVDALDHRVRYAEDEIDTLLFMARELMKAKKMERLGDTLHDFKNPAIASAGFARRLKKLVEGDLKRSKDQIIKYADILLEETTRLQELAMGIYQVGKEEVVKFTEVLERRFEINREAIREQLKQNIQLQVGPMDNSLSVCCYVINLERVFDNLLNNATKAIPLLGGILEISTFSNGEWACASITNTGSISEEERLRMAEDEGEGRGLYITHRIMRLLKGEIDILRGRDSTTVIVRMPRYSSGD
ncbi:MAG: GAF domain-containing protein [Desulfobacteraceae bacterium]|nr:MAG: GAF domain-containing protein [Desulfobacteraceae bacterium]